MKRNSGTEVTIPKKGALVTIRRGGHYGPRLDRVKYKHDLCNLCAKLL
jgi:hypothetical protein